MKKVILALSILLITNTITYANSTIYTDDIGRMHFLGKDPGGKNLQQVQNYNNPQQKEITNTTYKTQLETPNENESNTWEGYPYKYTPKK